MTAFAKYSERHDDDMEQLGELVQACLQEEGYEVTNFMDTRTSTTAYGGMYIRLRDGRQVSLSYDFAEWREADHG